MPKEIEALVHNHPCYNEEAHHHYARIHVAVAPACNIQCNYCNRKYDCSNESRPGVTSERLSPEEAIKKVLHVGAAIPQLSVVGIAGPGDALANSKATFKTFAYLNEHAPDLKLCLSTNGLALIDHIEALKAHRVHHVTVTINSVDESGDIGAKIYPWVYHDHKRYRGKAAAKLLLKRQLEGIKACVEAGILVKANSVLIPHINESHLGEVAKTLRGLGVFLHNIMPLISKKEYGTKFGLEGIPSASSSALMKAQEACGTDMKLMKHCRQCRADAVGLISQDRKNEFDKSTFSALSLETLAKNYDIATRQKTHARIETWRRALRAADARLETQSTPTLLVAVTSAGDGLINQHFGAASEFLIYEVDSAGVRFSHHRKVETQYCHGASNCDNNPIEDIVSTLKDVDLIVTAKIGPCPKAALERYQIRISEAYAHKPIEASLRKAAKAFVPFLDQKVG
jgi:nitrogen fixation protein NifB